MEKRPEIVKKKEEFFLHYSLESSVQIVLLLGHITVDEISIIFRDKLGTRKGILLPQDIMKYILLHYNGWRQEKRLKWPSI